MVYYRPNCVRISYCVHRLVSNKYLIEIIFDPWIPDTDVITLMLSKNWTPKHVKIFCICEVNFLSGSEKTKPMPWKPFVPILWRINRWTKYWPFSKLSDSNWDYTNLGQWALIWVYHQGHILWVVRAQSKNI